MSKPVIAVWFSCGAASAVAAKLTIEKYGSTHEIKMCNNPIAEEDSDNRRFLKDVEKWLGVTCEEITHPMFPSSSAVEVWEHKQFMSGPKGAPCTDVLKRQARLMWERFNKCDFLVLGLTHDEQWRIDNFNSARTGKDPVMIAPLADAGLTKQDCFDIISAAGIKLPHIYSLGFPNANCIGCVKSTSPTYWNLVRKHYPAVFQQRAEQSRRIGARLVRVSGERIFLDELDPSAKGRELKSFDCGVICTREDDDNSEVEAEEATHDHALADGLMHSRSGYGGSNTPSDQRDLWRTPPAIFVSLDAEFCFQLDAAAAPHNALCRKFITAEQNTLETPWADYLNVPGYVWLNPPYSDITPFVKKAAAESANQIGTVMLVPADTSVGWFKEAIQTASEVRFITAGRLAFINPVTGKPVSGNNKGSMLIIWRPYPRTHCHFATVDRDELMAFGAKLLARREAA